MSKDLLVHMDQKDLQDHQARKENVEIQENEAHQAKMDHLVNLESQEDLVIGEVMEIISIKNAYVMAQEERGVTKERRVKEEDLENLDHMVLRDSLVVIL